VTAAHIESIARWRPDAEPSTEIAFMPARVIMQDFTGVPAVVDLAAMRAATKRMGGDPARINPLLPAELVIDHSVQIDEQGTRAPWPATTSSSSSATRSATDFCAGARPRSATWPWCRPTPASFTRSTSSTSRAWCSRPPITSVPASFRPTRTPSSEPTRTPRWSMGSGSLGWGVGGIEAEAAMLGQPMPLLIPQVIGVRLSGQVREGVTATDLVLTITEILRKLGVVGKLVEFFGPGVPTLPLADRATIANMAPEYGATCGLFPIDGETLNYLRLTGRAEDSIRLVEAYCREQGIFAEPGQPEASYTKVVEFDMATVEASLAGPRRPQDRVSSSQVSSGFATALPSLIKPQKAGATVAKGEVAANPDIGTARSCSPPSRAAPTPRTRPCSSPPDSWPKRRSRAGLRASRG
jgi:aconitate hydratase